MPRFSDDYYADLERRLRDLLPLVDRVLPPEPVHAYTEFLDAGEYGVAVEWATDALSPQAVGATELAEALLKEGEVMGLDDSYLARLRAMAN